MLYALLLKALSLWEKKDEFFFYYFYYVSVCGLLHPHVHGLFTSLYYSAVIHCLKRTFIL